MHRSPRFALVGRWWVLLAGLALVAVSGCTSVRDAPPVAVSSEDFPLTVLLVESALEAFPDAEGLQTTLCRTTVVLRNDAPVAVEGVGLHDIDVLRSADGALLASATISAASVPASVGPRDQYLAQLEIMVGTLAAECGESLSVAVTAMADGVATTVQGHDVSVLCY